MYSTTFLMDDFSISQQRLINQGLVRSKFKNSKEVVKWFGAVQAQDYANAKWAIGLRLPNARNEDIEKAITKGEIIRFKI